MSSVFKHREYFKVPFKFDYRAWYPMHMSVQLKRMEGKLRSIDLIIEVHDARVPLTGRNSQFHSKLYAIRPHILVLNKMDLIDAKIYRNRVEQYYRNNGVQNILWTNCKTNSRIPIKNLLGAMVESLYDEPRYNRAVKTEYQAMVVGIPNVGKSSLINALRSVNLGKKKAAEEGNYPGVTVRVQNRVKILDRPPIYLIDTPGVLLPKIQNINDSMKLALCNLILESATNPYYVADYLLFWLNKTKDFTYVDMLELDGPSDNVQKLLISMCESLNLQRQCIIPGEGMTKRMDIDAAASRFIQMYREKRFNDACLDKDLLYSLD